LTLHKLYHAAHRHLADRRSVNREQSPTGASDEFFELASRGPTPDDAVAAADELTAVLRQLGDRERQVLEQRLQGYEHQEIAERLNCSERSVRRAINKIRRLMAARGGPQFVPSAARKAPSAAASLRRENGPAIDPLEAPLKWSDFLLREQIGAGATGKVYRALRRMNGDEVAIKFLRKSLAADIRAMSRFLSEAHTVAALRHPAIVPIHGAGRTPGGGLFLMMDLIRGKNLEQISRLQTVSVSDAMRWVCEAAQTVAFAHQQGVIHCDIKPSNLLLDEGNKIRVTDFGLAVHRSDENGSRSFWAGTPAFMAPEQADSCWGAISPRTDVWGLGSVLFFLLFGQPPHAAFDVPATLASVVSKTPVKIPDTEHTISQPVLQVLNHCLAKAPRDRIPTATDLANQLANCRLE
jgi:tRNA A-37 threonylcarbamoyl transferase component Bud32/DNA-binding CsgD family transcriptional regulator